jgi:diguanylate cyclase (GGDEF)-like protein
VARGIRQRLLISHLVAVVTLAGTLGAVVYAIAARQIVDDAYALLRVTAAELARALDGALADDVDPVVAQDRLAAALAAARHDHPDLDRIELLRDPALGSRRIAGVALDGPDLAPAERAVAVRLPLRAGYAIAVTLRRDKVDEPLAVLRLGSALAFLLCILVALVVSRHLADRFVARISDLTARCRALANGESLPPRRAGPRDELDDLAREFDAMAGRLRHAAASREQAAAALAAANADLERRMQERTAALVAANAKLKAEIEQRLHVEALLAEAAMTDPLTGVLNRRAQMEMLQQAARRLVPGEPGLAVILVDIDRFKQLNDRYGHAVGDRVLCAVAERLRDLCGGSQSHCVARWGGEEFLVLLPGVSLAAACERAEELRREVAAVRVDSIAVTASFGVTELLAGEALDAGLRRCDQALYRAKAAGRNTVVAAQGTRFTTLP